MTQEPTMHYDIKDFKALMVEYKGLRTFTDVASWDERARVELDEVAKGIRAFEEVSARASRQLAQLVKEREEKDFFSRMFASQKPEKSLAQLIQGYNDYKALLEGMASQLQEAIDFTPNSPEEQASLLKELKLRKKELQVEKRETAAAMKAIRTGARQQSAQAGRAGIYYNSRAAAYDRRSIRYQKEAALQPHEDAKAAVERQLLQVDKDILWAEKFT